MISRKVSMKLIKALIKLPKRKQLKSISFPFQKTTTIKITKIPALVN
jgi:hypothetical protein